MNKVSFVKHFLGVNNAHVLGVTETWLINAIPDAAVSIPNYTIFRNDVSGSVHEHGVGIYVHNSYRCLNMNIKVPNICTVFLTDYKIFIVVAYRPPSYSLQDNNTLIEFLTDFCTNREVIVMGDFNLPTISWSLGEVGVEAVFHTDRLFLNCFTTLDLTQWIDEPTNIRGSNTLDLFLTTETDRVVSSTVLPPFPNCDHCVILCGYIFQFTPLVSNFESISPFWPKANFKQINQFLSAIDWDFEFQNLNINDSYNKLVSYITYLGRIYVPQKSTCSSPKVSNKPWEFKPPKALTINRKNYWNHY